MGVHLFTKKSQARLPGFLFSYSLFFEHHFWADFSLKFKLKSAQIKSGEPPFFGPISLFDFSFNTHLLDPPQQFHVLSKARHLQRPNVEEAGHQGLQLEVFDLRSQHPAPLLASRNPWGDLHLGHPELTSDRVDWTKKSKL